MAPLSLTQFRDKILLGASGSHGMPPYFTAMGILMHLHLKSPALILHCMHSHTVRHQTGHSSTC